jgi:steroid delta-isomerase-like uncharacterized protein
MTTQTTKQIALDHLSRLNQGDVAGAAALMSEDCINHAAVPSAQGRKGFQAIVQKLRSAFPDMTYKVEDTLADGDRVMLRITATGTNTGTFAMTHLSFPPTGKSVSFEQIHVLRIANGQIVEHWLGQDTFAFMRQLGLQITPAA